MQDKSRMIRAWDPMTWVTLSSPSNHSLGVMVEMKTNLEYNPAVVRTCVCEKKKKKCIC